MSWTKFLSYHNSIPIAFSILLLGGTGAFAATNPEAIVSSTQQVISVDNTYIANKDLSSYSPRAEIMSVTEDEANYYISYRFYSIDVKDSVWMDVITDHTLTVAKAELGENTDLGLYVTEQLKQLIGHANEYLNQVQANARKQVTQKVIATEYGGIVGKFLDESTETLPGYIPVVTPPVPESQVAAGAASVSPIPSSQNQSVGSSQDPVPAVPQSSDGIQVMGKNPARIEVRTVYSDLGVYVSSPRYQPFNIHLTLDGKDVPYIQIDTSKTGTHTVTYSVIDDQGSQISATRIIEVYDPYQQNTVVTVASSTAP